MGEKHYSIYFTEEEHEKYTKLAKEKRSPLSIVIRDALNAVIANPHLLNPTEPKTDLETLIQALEISGEERIKGDKEFKSEIFKRFGVLENKITLLMKKAKIPKKEIAKIEGVDISGEEVFK